MLRYVVTGFLIAFFPSIVAADEALPWQQPASAPPAAAETSAAPPSAKFFPINPSVHMRAPTPQYVESINPSKPPRVQPLPHTAVAKPGSGLSEEQARQLLSIYAN